MQALAALAPAVAKVGVLVDVRLVEINQSVPVALRARQHGAQLVEKGAPPLRAGTPEQLAGFLPRQAEPVQGDTDRFAAAQAAQPVLHEACQALQRPARERVGPSYGLAGCLLLRGADFLAKDGFDPWAKGGRPPVRW